MINFWFTNEKSVQYLQNMLMKKSVTDSFLNELFRGRRRFNQPLATGLALRLRENLYTIAQRKFQNYLSLIMIQDHE